MNDRTTVYFAIAAVFLVFLAFIVLQYRHSWSKTPVVQITGSLSESAGEPAEVKFLEKGKYPSFASGTMEPGSIRLELSPAGFENGVFKVRYFANAHDLLLDEYDLVQMTTLQYDDQRLKPARFDRMKGHHDSGLIFFEIGKLHDPPSPLTFTITVRGLPRQEVRVFSWN